MKKLNIIIILFMLLITTLVVVPFAYAKYTDTFTKHISLNVTMPRYTVTFHSNNGENTTSIQNFVYGTSQNLNANTFSLVHNNFTSWNTSSNGKGNNYTDEQSVSNLTQTNGDNINLYAMWTPYEYKINYVGLVDTSSLPEYALANNTLTINDINSSIYGVSSIVMGGNTLSSSDYSFNNNILSINVPIISEITITFEITASYTFIVDDTAVSGSNAIFEAPISGNFTLADSLTSHFNGINVYNRQISSIVVTLTYTTTKGSTNIINVDLATSNNVNATQPASFLGKQTNQTVSVTFNNVNLSALGTFDITFSENDVNNRTVDINKIEVNVIFANN